ncbi:bifunctional adenosylcobinamide kinase/adenosylcobinamide-phosphate guanylyltransferase [Cohnella caldifontis]|uniref:bifunctional adenosylcobinamide kinase/adenosylcobinamide-phosphate guanylyltransferase n=1 Tax=Cohnella caldifontis TaxID=3027471 RepID=UPI0023EAE121|nr:bifunctional adenosylcobinamide kinase/adenosylcobinamide-phosphate guanylyltransferase [Cohnella sp. YIM B05605]
MLLLILGGVGSGKSAYAAQWAQSLGREAIRLSCPAFPGEGSPPPRTEAEPGPTGFVWKEWTADETLDAVITRINLESNLFRADRRVLVVDSLSGWLRAALRRDRIAGARPGTPGDGDDTPLRRVVQAILAYQGKRIVVSEEPYAGLADDPWERRYAGELAEAVRRLAGESHAVYRLTAGFASELKGRRV